MLKFTALITIASLAFSVSASAITARQSQGPVVCGTFDSGVIQLLSLNQTAAPLLTGGTNTSLYYTSAASAFLVTGGVEPQYAFQQCNSSFMGYPPGTGATERFYGHIVATGNGQTSCLTAALGASDGSPYMIFNDECSYADDESQLPQYWLYIEAFRTLQFVGVSSSGATSNNDGITNYELGLGTFDDQQAIQVQAFASPAPAVVEMRFGDGR